MLLLDLDIRLLPFDSKKKSSHVTSLSEVLLGYSISVLSGVCDVGSGNHSKISGHIIIIIIYNIFIAPYNTIL